MPLEVGREKPTQTVEHESHRRCIVCGAEHPFGLHLDFVSCDDGSVEATFECEPLFEGYPGMLHGGITSMLLDGAMTNCLFAQGHPGVTGELTVRFVRPVVTKRSAVVRAWVDDTPPPFFVLRSEMRQGDRVCARASAKFVDHPHLECDDEQTENIA